MLICLIGHSSSGKSTVEKTLYEKGYNKLISYTTRPPRDGEVNGVDYHYIDIQQFRELESEGFFHEIAQYRDWYYGISLDGIDLQNEVHIAVVTVHGYTELSKHTDDIIAIHIKLEERERIIRQIKRGDTVDEVFRRIHADRIDFDGVEDICDYTVNNDGNLVDTVTTIEKIINKHKG